MIWATACCRLGRGDEATYTCHSAGAAGPCVGVVGCQRRDEVLVLLGVPLKASPYKQTHREANHTIRWDVLGSRS